MFSYKMHSFDTEQRWSDGTDSQAPTDVSRKGRRKSDVSEEVIGENAGMCVWFFVFIRASFSFSSSMEVVDLNPLKPCVITQLHFKCSAPYKPNLPFLISNFRALWRSALSARVPECWKLKM